jgi:hypothetical protein
MSLSSEDIRDLISTVIMEGEDIIEKHKINREWIINGFQEGFKNMKFDPNYVMRFHNDDVYVVDLPSIR